MILTVACVLRSGGPYGPEYVHRLLGGVAEHLRTPHRFVCLTDMDVAGVETVALKHGWPGYWSKIELFRSGLFSGRVLYLDLDNDIVGPLDDLASFPGRFGMIDDWIHPELGSSAVMMWHTDSAPVHDIWEPFVRSAQGAMASYRGDQNWISGSVGWEPLRSLYPGQIVSRWRECVDNVPDGARIVCWHGSVRPHLVDWAPTGTESAWKAKLTPAPC